MMEVNTRFSPNFVKNLQRLFPNMGIRRGELHYFFDGSIRGLAVNGNPIPYAIDGGGIFNFNNKRGALYEAKVFRKEETKNLIIEPANIQQIDVLVKINNSVIDSIYEKGLEVGEAQMRNRLILDPESVIVAKLDAKEEGLINTIKINTKGFGDIPKTSDELTTFWTFANTEVNGNTWLCPWVATLRSARGFKTIHGNSVGQRLVLTVRNLARSSPNAVNVIAYSRPSDLRAYFEVTIDGIEFSPGFQTFDHPDLGKTFGYRIFTKKYGELFTDRLGIYFLEGNTKKYLLYILQYWNIKKEDRKVDLTFDFHATNGANISEELIFPMGNVYDKNSLFYRTGLVYDIIGVAFLDFYQNLAWRQRKLVKSWAERLLKDLQPREKDFNISLFSTEKSKLIIERIKGNKELLKNIISWTSRDSIKKQELSP